MLERIGGPDRDRTDDLFHAMEARSQLRHRPTFAGYNSSIVSALHGFVKQGAALKMASRMPLCFKLAIGGVRMLEA